MIRVLSLHLSTRSKSFSAPFNEKAAAKVGASSPPHPQLGVYGADFAHPVQQAISSLKASHAQHLAVMDMQYRLQVSALLAA